MHLERLWQQRLRWRHEGTLLVSLAVFDGRRGQGLLSVLTSLLGVAFLADLAVRDRRA